MQRALKRWKQLKKQKGYANDPVPAVESTLPPRLEQAPFVLRVNSRDLPRSGRESGVRFDEKRHASQGWLAFTKWAWNENWLAVDDPQVLVPRGKDAVDVDDEFVRGFVREMLIDNVRGQAGAWREAAVKTARLTMQRGPSVKGRWTIVYRGEVDLDDGERSIKGRLYGEGLFDPRKKELIELELVALGMREGAHRFNQRSEDLGPAPIGFAVTRWVPPAKPR